MNTLEKALAGPLCADVVALVAAEVEKQLKVQNGLLTAGIDRNERETLAAGETVGQLAATIENHRILLQDALLSARDLGSQINQAFAEIDGMMKESAAQTNAFRGLSCDIRGYIGGLSACVETIANVASTTRLLAINVQIQAANLGQAGRPFGVVAQVMTQLSTQSGKASESIRDLVDSAGTLLATMATATTELADQEEERAQRLTSLSSECQGSFEQSLRRIDEGLGGISAIIEMTRKGAGQIMTNVQDVDRLRQIIEGAAQRSEMIKVALQRLAQLVGESPEVDMPTFRGLVAEAVRFAEARNPRMQGTARLIAEGSVDSGTINFL